MFDSCHPKHARNNIPFNLARRLNTFVSDSEILNSRQAELQNALLQRHYPAQLIQHRIEKAN
jgi:hypothetical protein